MAQNKVFYLTKDGLKKLEVEHQKLKSLRKIKLGKETPKVLSSEDLNTEFISFKEDLDYIDFRLSEIEYILKHFEIIKSSPNQDRDKVGLGARVVIELDGDTDEFLIVGTLEANPSLGRISNDSPVGRALQGHKAGDEVVINSPIKTVYKIKKISYKNA